MRLGATIRALRSRSGKTAGVIIEDRRSSMSIQSVKQPVSRLRGRQESAT